MDVGTVFVNNRTQAVRLPVESRFPENVKKVVVRVVGKDRVSDDFMTERASQEQRERESF
jgi:antitoxin VapB